MRKFFKLLILSLIFVLGLWEGKRSYAAELSIELFETEPTVQENIEESIEDKEEVNVKNDIRIEQDGETMVVNLADLEGDNADKIQKALDLANKVNATKGTVSSNVPSSESVKVKSMKIIVPEGNYQLSDELQLYANTEFELYDAAVILAGEGKTLFNGEHAVTVNGGNWEVNSNNVVNEEIKGLVMKNSRFTSEKGSQLYINTSAEVSVNDCVFDNVSLHLGADQAEGGGTYNFIIADGTANITGNTINNGKAGFGIYIGSNYKNLTINSNTINNVSGNGILCYAAGSRIVNNTINGCSIGIYATGADSLKINGNKVNRSVTHGIFIKDAATVELTKNTVNGGSEQGINLSKSTGIIIKGNVIENIANQAILLNDNCVDAQIDGNTLRFSTIAVYILKSNNVKLINNQIFTLNDIGFLVDQVQNMQIEGNRIDGGKQQGINVKRSQKIKIVGNEIKNFLNSALLVAEASVDIGIENNKITLSGSGMYVDASKVVAKGNTVGTSQTFGMLFKNSPNVMLDTNSVSQSGGNGIQIEACSSATIKNSKIFNNGGAGVVVSNSAKANITSNMFEANKVEGLHVENCNNATIKKNQAAANLSNAYGITLSNQVIIESNLTYANQGYGIIVTGAGNGNNVFNNSNVIIKNNTISNDYKSGIVVTGATAIIDTNTVTETGAGGGEGIVAVYSYGTWIKNNQVSKIKTSQPGVIGNGIIVADNSKKCYIYKNTVTNCANHGIQVTYAATDITTLGNNISGSGNQGLTYSRNASGVVGGNQVKHSGNHNIICETANVKVGGNYVVGGGKVESIAFNKGCSGTAKGNIIVGSNYRFFINDSSVSQEDNVVVASEPATNPYKEIGNVENFVKRLYSKVLLRVPEESGLADWTGFLLVREITGAEAASGFFESGEFTSKNVSDRKYVDTLYDAMFDTNGDPAGIKFWLNDLETGFSRTYLLKGFAESVQFDNLCNRYGIKRGTITLLEPRDKNRGLTQFVSRIYIKALNRSKIDAGGMNTWCEEILSGRRTPAGVVEGFIFSKEFNDRKLSDDDFINVLYSTYFDRKADSAGFNTWKKILDKNPNRANVLNGFSGSQEFFDLVARFGL